MAPVLPAFGDLEVARSLTDAHTAAIRAGLADHARLRLGIRANEVLTH